MCCNTLPYDSNIVIEVDDSTFARTESDKAKVCGALPYDSDVVIECDE